MVYRLTFMIGGRNYNTDKSVTVVLLKNIFYLYSTLKNTGDDRSAF